MVAQTVKLPAGQHACAGIDLHKETLMSCTPIRGSGEISWRRIACKNREQIVEFFNTLPRPHTVAIEAVGFYRWLWELLEPIVDKLVLADATQARGFQGRATPEDRPRRRREHRRTAGRRPSAAGLCSAAGSASLVRLDTPA